MQRCLPVTPYQVQVWVGLCALRQGAAAIHMHADKAVSTIATSHHSDSLISKIWTLARYTLTLRPISECIECVR